LQSPLWLHWPLLLPPLVNPQDSPLDSPQVNPPVNPQASLLDSLQVSPQVSPLDNPQASLLDSLQDNPQASPLDNPQDNLPVSQRAPLANPLVSPPQLLRLWMSTGDRSLGTSAVIARVDCVKTAALDTALAS